jgi:PPOX class probable F420-dependent enzyme
VGPDPRPGVGRPGDAVTSGGLALVRRVAAADHFLAVLVTIDAAGAPQVSLVNAGVLAHPVTAAPCVGLVARGGTVKLRNLRRRPHATVVFRAGWEWVAVAGPCQLAGPDDPLPGLPADRLPGLLQGIFHAAGGSHPDLDEYDRVMAAERRTAVLVEPERITTNPPGT